MRGLDLARLWRDRRLRYLLNLIEHLPADSLFVEAQADDEEALVEPDADAVRLPPRLSQYGPTVQALAAVVDRLGEVVNVLVMANGGKPQTLRPYPRPVTAVQRARQRSAEQHARGQHDRLVSVLTPKESA